MDFSTLHICKPYAIFELVNQIKYLQYFKLIKFCTNLNE